MMNSFTGVKFDCISIGEMDHKQQQETNS